MGTFMFDDGPISLRHELRALMEEKLPPEWLGPFTADPEDKAMSDAFCRELAARGLLVPEWPAEFGGSDMTLDRGLVIREEMWSHSEPRGGQYYGPNWIGPAIMEFGTDEQRALHLSPIARGAVVWCQGFSEPDAGSDLAAMRTRAEPDGDGFRITGQKVWTSWAGWAEWCFLLAKVPTESDDARAGVTVFLIPMNRKGIEVRPIDGLPGPHHLNEVFFDGVRAERSEVLGRVAGGWDVVRAALSHERVGIARYARSDRMLSRVASHVAVDRPSTLRSDWMRARILNRVSRLVCRRTLAAQAESGSLEFEANAARLITVRADQFAADVTSDALGAAFFEDRSTAGAPFGGAVEFFWRYSQGATIASGTTEMLQLRLVSELKKGRRLSAAEEVADVGEAVTNLIGGVDRLPALRRAVDDPSSRQALRDAMTEMISGLDPRDGLDSAEQAAEVARRCGMAAAPLPIEAMLLARDGVPVAWAGPGGVLEHADLYDRWLLVGEEPLHAIYRAAPLGTRTGAFVVPEPDELTHAPAPGPADAPLALALQSGYILGALETSLDLATRYACERVQFGAPIITRQAVGFRLADVVAELYGIQSLLHYTLWRIDRAPHKALSDALALRWYAVDLARRSLRVAHQALGAIGLTYEHDHAMITAALQPRLRLPFSVGHTLDRVVDAVRVVGFASLFPPDGEPHAG
ncbi:acyl-CoA dehydrogenase family protein [Microbacterium immunditiarum]|uniref:Alkylation response protein AidB-like acyl-CoA dehydrogenase n=1 Tax=Microbacterium immunditiarum TaxID=337480 RepID=A0A7Y9GMH4_9MICO|nr:acyl-CoA dehydrogenase family protein [Microbacterium immunditiarum]NYE19232.1 alkylation response protein AidB-like acyl-CoA dehydrogenase [Microbacterium immunditiarum]